MRTLDARTPVLRGGLCLTAHPEGCARQVRRATAVRPLPSGPRRVLVVGSASGLGLATRVATAYGMGADTIGVCLERPGTPRRTGTAGWYAAAALEEELARTGRYGRTVLGDAFADRTKERTAALVRSELGQLDLVVYSLAAPVRRHPRTGEVHRSVIKAVGEPFTELSWDPSTGAVVRVTLPAADAEEIRQTVSVMGGADWRGWIEVLRAHNALAPGATTLAFSYRGPDWLAPSYRHGTLGAAKRDLEATARALDTLLRPDGGRALIAVMPPMVTRASSVIPVQNLYTVLLARVLGEQRLLPGPHVARLLRRLYGGAAKRRPDAEGHHRLDSEELAESTQRTVRDRWERLRTDPAALDDLGDPEGYRHLLLRQHGYEVPDVDYRRRVDPVRTIPHLVDVDAPG